MARVDRAARVAKGQREAAIDVPRTASSRPRLCRRLARRFAQCTRGASRAPTAPLGRQLTDTLVDHRSLAPSPPWAGRDGEGRSGSKGGEGPARGSNRVSPAQMGLLVHPTIPALSAATISKVAVKPAAPPSNRTGVGKPVSERLFSMPFGTIATLRTHCSPRTDCLSDESHMISIACVCGMRGESSTRPRARKASVRL
jgi:hypothetical protein